MNDEQDIVDLIWNLSLYCLCRQHRQTKKCTLLMHQRDINIIICLIWSATTSVVVVDKDELKNHPLLITIIIKYIARCAPIFPVHIWNTHTHTKQKEYNACYRGNYKIKICASMSRRILWGLGCNLWISNNFGVSKYTKNIKRMSLLSIVYRIE